MNIRDLSNELSNQYKILEGRCGIWARRCFCENINQLTRTDLRRGGHEVRQPRHFYLSNLFSRNEMCQPEAGF